MSLSGASRWRFSREPGELVFVAGALVWLAAMLLRWPMALSFEDEIGYLGQARLFLDGRLFPTPYSPGVWNAGPHGLVAQYPLLTSVLITPLVAISPLTVFISGALAALALAWTVGRVLKSWGHSPAWSLIVLAHPTIVVLARTVMSDLIWSAFAVGAWWALRNQRSFLAMTLLGATMATRPTGVIVAAALVAGEVLEARRGASTNAAARPVLAMGLRGIALGTLLVLATNLISTGTIRFGYSYHKGLRPFHPTYFLLSAPTYARALLLNPPLLVIGLWPFWQRRMWAPLLVVAGLGGLMCFYCFVDTGPGFIESLVLSERLILPVVAFLLIGYGALLSQIANRLWIGGVADGVLVLAPALIMLQIGSRHQVWHRPMRQAREAAASLAAQYSSSDLGLTFAAAKAGLLHSGKVAWIGATGPRPPVVLCGSQSNHFRAPTMMDPREALCEVPGYRGHQNLPDGYRVMLRDDLFPR